MKFNKYILSAIFLFSLNMYPCCAIQDYDKYPDYSEQYLGEDKYESFNRKMFNLNMKFNKYALRPIHILWASVMPKYGMDRIQGVYTNIQYPKRLISSLIQKDFKTSKSETMRFLTNSTLGLGGMFDPASKVLNIEARDESMDEALAKCNVKQGPYLVMPWLNSTSPRGMVGSLLDNALNPSTYIASPVLALVKLGFTVNRTYYMQPIVKMLESTYADPYDIAKKMYGLERYIKTNNYDKKEILNTDIELLADAGGSRSHDPFEIQDPGSRNTGIYNRNEGSNSNGITPMNVQSPNIDILRPPYSPDNYITPTLRPQNNVTAPPSPFINKVDDNLHQVSAMSELKADINLDEYSPQNPVIDAMRTALFQQEGGNNSIWSDLSIWNRSFSKRIKTASISIDSTKDNYKYRYILQKDKTSPVAIIYPSVGEGINSSHSDILAKMFYDEGYSVIIQGSHFHWEFVKSMPDVYKPGLPSRDADYLKLVTRRILDNLEDKNNCNFKSKTLIGTSFGAMTTLFVADKESENNTLGIDKYISINPPIELIYAMREIDRNTSEWQKNPDNLKERVAITASKVIQLANMKNNENAKFEVLPFNTDEAKLITGFVLHQKLSDLVFTLEGAPKDKKSNIYKMVNNMTFEDYARRYLVNNADDVDKIAYEASLHSISEFLKTHDNYKIYHSIDDYLVNHSQLVDLRNYARENLVLLNNGSHLGFLYRDEFLTALKKDIKQKDEIIASR